MDLMEANKMALEILSGFSQGYPFLKEWSFSFDNAQVRFGSCNYRKKTITLSRKLTELNSETEVKETILHEVSHAIAGKKYQEYGHGPFWRLAAIEVGAKPQRCYSNSVNGTKHTYERFCPHCNIVTKKLYRYSNATNRVCRHCGNRVHLRPNVDAILDLLS